MNLYKIKHNLKHCRDMHLLGSGDTTINDMHDEGSIDEDKNVFIQSTYYKAELAVHRDERRPAKLIEVPRGSKFYGGWHYGKDHTVNQLAPVESSVIVLMECGILVCPYICKNRAAPFNIKKHEYSK